MLTAGTYMLKVWTNVSVSSLSPGDYINMTGTVDYSLSLGIKNFNMMVGGLRVKSILNYDGVNPQPVNDRYFSYTSPFLINPVDTANDNTNSYTTTQNNQTTGCIFAKKSRAATGIGNVGHENKEGNVNYCFTYPFHFIN